MNKAKQQETFKEVLVTYTIEFEGKFYLIENVPAKEYLETGERFYSPQTVEKIQQIIWENTPPKHYLQTPVYEFSSTPS